MFVIAGLKLDLANRILGIMFVLYGIKLDLADRILGILRQQRAIAAVSLLEFYRLGLTIQP